MDMDSDSRGVEAPWSASKLSETICRYVEMEDAAPGDITLVLCDPVIQEPADAWRDAGFSLPEPQRIACGLQPSFQPYLLRLPSGFAGERLLQATIETALAEADYGARNTPAAHSVCAWLQLPSTMLDELTRALSRRAGQFFEGAPRVQAFRFWDPRVFVHLPRIYGPLFDSWLNMPVHWRWIDGSGRLREQAFKPQHTPATVHPAQGEHIVDALALLGDINNVLVHTGLILRGAEAQDGAAIEPHVRHARQLGCSDLRDVVMYAAAAHRLGGRFEHATCLQSYLAPFRAGELDFHLAALAVPEGIWDEAAYELAIRLKHNRHSAGEPHP